MLSWSVTPGGSASGIAPARGAVSEPATTTVNPAAAAIRNLRMSSSFLPPEQIRSTRRSGSKAFDRPVRARRPDAWGPLLAMLRRSMSGVCIELTTSEHFVPAIWFAAKGADLARVGLHALTHDPVRKIAISGSRPFAKVSVLLRRRGSGVTMEVRRLAYRPVLRTEECFAAPTTRTNW
jgi:hypothetical protein